MQRLIIGSAAMQQYIHCRDPKDLDIFTPDDVSELADFPGLRVEPFWHPALAEFVYGNRFATLDELYTIKLSHAFWELKNNSWEKHMHDMVEMKKAGAQVIEGFYQTLYKIWENKHGKKRVSLNMSADMFFTNAVKRIYDHDSIHASVAYYDRPLYESTLKDQVAVDMAKIKSMSFDDQIKLFREEVYATALERIVIPKNYKCSPRAAYAWALRRTITSLTKGWSARFMAENYDIFRKPDVDYVRRHIENKDRLILLEK